MKKVLLTLLGIIVILAAIVLIKTYTYPFKKALRAQEKAGSLEKMIPQWQGFQGE
jgi:hypothetical protein